MLLELTDEQFKEYIELLVEKKLRSLDIDKDFKEFDQKLTSLEKTIAELKEVVNKRSPLIEKSN